MHESPWSQSQALHRSHFLDILATKSDMLIDNTAQTGVLPATMCSRQPQPGPTSCWGLHALRHQHFRTIGNYLPGIPCPICTLGDTRCRAQGSSLGGRACLRPLVDGLDGVCYEGPQLGCSCHQGCISFRQPQERDAQGAVAWHIHWNDHLLTSSCNNPIPACPLLYS